MILILVKKASSQCGNYRIYLSFRSDLKWNFEAQNLPFLHVPVNFQFLKNVISKWKNLESKKLLESPKLISRKVWVTGKSWNFHICKFKRNTKWNISSNELTFNHCQKSVFTSFFAGFWKNNDSSSFLIFSQTLFWLKTLKTKQTEKYGRAFSARVGTRFSNLLRIYFVNKTTTKLENFSENWKWEQKSVDVDFEQEKCWFESKIRPRRLSSPKMEKFWNTTW